VFLCTDTPATAIYTLPLHDALPICMVWGEQPLRLNTPALLSEPVQIMPGFYYSSFRLFIIVTGLAVAAALYVLVTKTRVGMRVRSEEHTSELQSRENLVCRLLLEKK